MFYLGTKYSRGDECDLPRRERQAAADARWAATASASRASSARRSSRTTTSAASSGPTRIAPFTRGGLPDRLRPQRRRARPRPTRLHDELAAAGVDVMLDDRGERPGAMFADWELIGVPHRVVISDRGLKEGTGRVPGPARRAGHAGRRWPSVADAREGQAGGMTRGARARLAGAARAGCAAGAAGGRCRACRRAGRRAAGRLGALGAVGGRSPTARRRKPRVRRHRRAAGLPALARRDERAAEEAQGRPRARASSSSRPSGTRAGAPGSSRRWCSA